MNHGRRKQINNTKENGGRTTENIRRPGVEASGRRRHEFETEEHMPYYCQRRISDSL